ncbi:hypothetical protein FB45DRAFT_869116 [Roridomyces roridus]|uniref:Uncharacterized protein n=1 Tax=Roridomyces roridus TaxID=1738132 RepID=A0AAD7FIE6_9AGAR|nr:hypothetical protein FB45DRAFT_869116 [Roridomyces roridus]
MPETINSDPPIYFVSRRLEHLPNVNRKEVSDMDQPSRLHKNLQCLTAQVEIFGVLAYVLFDSGSTIDSLSPDFATFSGCKTFRLTEQVTLQLGCRGSKSTITFGIRPAVNFGGIRGHVYFDIANLDLYDGIVRTPFMIKHRLILDFAKHVIRFPNNRGIKALSTLQEATLRNVRESELESSRGRVLAAGQ